MNDPQEKTEEVTIALSSAVLRHVDRIVAEKETSRAKVINDILKDRFSRDDDWIEGIIQ